MLLNRILPMPNPVHPTHAKLFSMCGKITLHHFHPCIERKYACSEYFSQMPIEEVCSLKPAFCHSLKDTYLSFVYITKVMDVDHVHLIFFFSHLNVIFICTLRHLIEFDPIPIYYTFFTTS